LALHQDPEIAALMAVRPSIVAPPERRRRHPHEARPRPARADRWCELARSILADRRNVARVAAAGSPYRRRRMLGRLARAALASQRPRDPDDLAAIR